MNEWIMGLWNQHGYLLIPVAWLAASALLNWMFRFKSAEEWVAFTEKNPKTAAMLRLIRALGVDPVKALNSAKGLADQKGGEAKDSLRETVRAVVEEVIAEKAAGVVEATDAEPAEPEEPGEEETK
jgi:hypothetical protein